jgi:acyl dehydratase
MNAFSASVAAVVGDEREALMVDSVERSMFVRYAGASGDFNPIHWDREFARSAGYDDVFAMGMFPAGVLAGFLSGWLGRESVRRFRCRFVDQTWAGEQLICGGRVVRVVDEVDTEGQTMRWAECELRLHNRSGATKLIAWASCAVRTDS